MVLGGTGDRRHRHRDDQHAGPAALALHPGLARRDPQGRLADAAGNDADGDCRFRVHADHGVFFWALDSGLLWLTRTRSSAKPTLPSKRFKGNTSVALRWYIVHAYSNFEHKVKAALEERIERMGLQDKFGEILVPTEEVVEMREGQKRRSERKFFPGYVLVQMEMDDETWHLVKEVPKVLGFIGGSSDRPAPITEKEADQILQRVKEGVDKPRPKVLFEPGEVVRVIDGPFNDFIGVWWRR